MDEPADRPVDHASAAPVAPASRLRHVGVRVVVLVALLVILGSWSQRHLGTAIPGLVLAGLGLLKKVYDLVGGAEKQAHERWLRGVGLFFLSDGFLSTLALVTLVCCAVVSSVTLMAAGTSGSTAVRLAPEGETLDGDDAKTLDGPADVARFLCFTTPMGRPFYLAADGYQRHSIDVYPWSGVVVRLDRDLKRSPAVVLRVPMAMIRNLGVLDLELQVGDADSTIRVPTVAGRGSFALGRDLYAPAGLLAEWRSELKAAGVGDVTSESLVRAWRDPLRVPDVGGLAPGTPIRAWLANADGDRVARARLLVSDEEIQDVLFTPGDE